jgi:PTH1 family peptidyl-tRNA hydrolase
MKRTVVVGLGNPGEEFRATYHNVGNLALGAFAEKLAAESDIPEWKKHKKLFSYITIGPFALVAPLTFMNESGLAVKEALKKFDVGPEDLIVLHDESDLIIGTYKITSGQGAAGHKGVGSIMDNLGVKDFRRVRIGIREKEEVKRKKASAFVLDRITPRDMETFAEVFKKIGDAIAE